MKITNILHLWKRGHLPDLKICFLFISIIDAHYFPIYGIISWCLMCWLLQTSDSANSRIQEVSTLALIHSPLGCVHRVWNYEELILQPKLGIKFVDLFQNAGILLLMQLVFSMVSSKSYTVCAVNCCEVKLVSYQINTLQEQNLAQSNPKI